MKFVANRPGSVIHTFFSQIQPDSPLQVYHISHGIAQPGYETPTLIQKNYVLHLILSGSMLDGQQLMKAGDMYLSLPDIAHKLTILPGKPLEQYWLEFSGSEAERLIAASSFAKAVVLEGIDFAAVTPLLREAVYREQSEYEASMRMMGMLYLLFSLCPAPPQTASKPENYVRNAMDFLRTNLHQGIGIRDAAQSVGISERYLYRLFLQEVGFTPICYLTVCRKERSKELLRSTDLSVTQIAEACGFSDQSYFSRFFHRECGCSPSEYRQSFTTQASQ